MQRLKGARQSSVNGFGPIGKVLPNMAGEQCLTLCSQSKPNSAFPIICDDINSL